MRKSARLGRNPLKKKNSAKETPKRRKKTPLLQNVKRITEEVVKRVLEWLEHLLAPLRPRPAYA